MAYDSSQLVTDLQNEAKTLHLAYLNARISTIIFWNDVFYAIFSRSRVKLQSYLELRASKRKFLRFTV